ncbi:alpha/beta hydrolase [Candidatus Saccharibacteria bacterium]|jgi:predicted alpha/beta hydrolase family esterase|nr:alpha/beta hydrolase [Candidatus Saccharibacteria bacterium]
MRNAIILHGKPDREEYYDPKVLSMSNLHWIPWLQAQLIKKDIIAATPDVPEAYNPQWDKWVKEVERYEIGPQTILVGHSCGGGFWIKYLSLNKNLRVGKVIVVAPWLDPEGDETEGFFADYTVDEQLASRTDGLTVFHSDNDMGNVHKSVAMIREKVKDVGYKEFKSYGHFTYKDMQTIEFPELLDECL